MNSTDATLTTCGNCRREIAWSAPEPGDGHGYWRHTGATESGFLFCYSTTGATRLDPNRPRATPAPGQEHTGPTEAGPTPGEGFDPDLFTLATAAAHQLPPSSEVHGDPALYTRARAAELIDAAMAFERGQAPAPGAEWIGTAVATMEELIRMTRPATARPDCEDCQTTAGCRCNEGNR